MAKPTTREVGQLLSSAPTDIADRRENPTARRSDCLVRLAPGATLVVRCANRPKDTVRMSVHEPGEKHTFDLLDHDPIPGVFAYIAVRPDGGNASIVPDEYRSVLEDLQLTHLRPAACPRGTPTCDHLRRTHEQGGQSVPPIIGSRRPWARAVSMASG